MIKIKVLFSAIIMFVIGGFYFLFDTGIPFISEVEAKQENPLHVAVWNGNLPAVKKMIEQGTKVDSIDEHGQTPLYLAVERNRPAFVKYLLEHGAEVNREIHGGLGGSLLHIAVTRNSLDITKYLVERGININTTMNIGEPGVTPLHIAAGKGNFDIVKYLVGHNANVNLKTSNGITPLYSAVMSSNPQIIRYLLKQGVSVNAVTKNDGSTALHRAVSKGSFETVKLLVEYKASLEIKMRGGALPLHRAVMENTFEIAKYLVESGAQVDAVLEDGATPLYLAAEKGRLNVAMYLVEQGADINKADARGVGPVMIAEHNGHHQVAAYLRSKKRPFTKSFYFPECGVRMYVPEDWHVSNETRFVKLLGEEKATIPIGEVLVSKEKVSSKRSYLDTGFKTGLIFETGQEYVNNMAYPSTKAYADDIVPYLMTVHENMTDKKEYQHQAPLGTFKVYQANAEKDGRLFTYAYGALRTDHFGNFLFIAQSPAAEWEESKGVLFAILQNIEINTQQIAADEVMKTNIQVEGK